MSETIYLIMSHRDDTFDLKYAGDCAKTDSTDYLTKHPKFACWLREGGGEESLYMAILPMPGSSDAERARIVDKIVGKYRPVCNQ